MRRGILLLMLAAPLLMAGNVGYVPGLPNQFGINGGVGNETTLQAIYDMKEFAAIPSGSFRNVYHFSSYSGSDSNNCTELAPCQTWGHAKDLSTSFTHIKFKAGEVWSPLVLTMDQNYGYQIGEDVDWNAGADVGIVVGVDPATKTIVVREVSGAGTDPDAADDIITIDNRITGGVAAVTDTLGTSADDGIIGGCDAGELCTLWSGDFENPPVVDCNDTNPEGNQGILSTGAGTGTSAFQNFKVQHCDTDAISQSGANAIVALNVDTIDIVQVGAASHNAATTHDTGDLIALNGNLSAVADSGGASSSVALTSTGSSTFISQGYIHADGTTEDGQSAAFFQQSAGPSTIVGSYVYASTPGSAKVTLVKATVPVGGTVLNTCRATFNGSTAVANSNMIAPTFSSTGTYDVNMWETTFGAGVRGLQWTADDGDIVDLTTRGTMFYGLSDCSFCDFDSDGFYSQSSFDVEGIYDDDTFTINSVTSRTKAQIDADTDGGDAWTFFDSNSLDPPGASHEPWDSAAGAARPQLAIDPACGDATDATTCYDVDLAAYSCPLAKTVPAFVLGKAFSTLRLTEGKLGAR